MHAKKNVCYVNTLADKAFSFPRLMMFRMDQTPRVISDIARGRRRAWAGPRDLDCTFMYAARTIWKNEVYLQVNPVQERILGFVEVSNPRY